MSTASTALDAANVVVVAGTLSSPPRRRILPSGEELVSFDLTTRGAAGTCSVPVAWFSPGSLVDRLDTGSEVVVAGHLRRRFFRAGGATQSRTEVVAARVVDGNRRAAATKLRADVGTKLAAG